MTSQTALERAIGLGGVASFAAAIGVAASAPSMWKARGKVPAEHCPAIERFTRDRGDPVTCEELRPDIPWGVLREPHAPAAQDAPHVSGTSARGVLFQA